MRSSLTELVMFFITPTINPSSFGIFTNLPMRSFFASGGTFTTYFCASSTLIISPIIMVSPHTFVKILCTPVYPDTMKLAEILQHSIKKLMFAHPYHCGIMSPHPVSYTHLRAHETRHDLVCR